MICAFQFICIRQIHQRECKFFVQIEILVDRKSKEIHWAEQHQEDDK